MTKVWYLFYNFLVIPFLSVFFHAASLFNQKIKSGLKGRRRLFEELILNLTGLDKNKKMVWFHSSSMGEFEQAKPIIQQLKMQSDINLIVTFFSPSGFKNSHNYPYADIVSYLPFDSPAAVSHFLNLVKPALTVFMRYDIWPNIIWQLNSRKIPTFLVDATMRANSKRKMFLSKSFHKSLFKNITRIFTVSEDDLEEFKDFDLDDSQLLSVGDTRFDRVYQKSLEAKNKKIFKDDFFSGKKVFVFGSSWESDENVILPAFLKLMKYDNSVVLILVPHEPTMFHLEKVENSLNESTRTIRFSYLNNYKNERIIIVDSIGILLTLYYYADVAYVGGSFKQGIHNVLEPAVYGIPVMYGPKIQNSQEAVKLAKIGGGLVVKNKNEAYRHLRKLFADSNLRMKLGNICSEFTNQNVGATNKILSEIKSYL